MGRSGVVGGQKITDFESPSPPRFLPEVPPQLMVSHQ